jgi:hypothetical protein
MSKFSLQDLIALLSEAGVELSARQGSSERIQKAAQRLGIELSPEDLRAVDAIRGARAESRSPTPEFLVNILHHPQLNVPSRRHTIGGGGSGAPPGPRQPQPGTGWLPPWGQMEERLLASIDASTVPIDWTPEDHSEPTLSKWKEWVKKIVMTVSTTLWPIYEPGSATWDASLSKLLDTDFNLLDDLHDNFGLPIDGMYPTTVLHSDFFTEEDNGEIDFGTDYERYDPTLLPHAIQCLPIILMAGIADKVGTLDLQLKQFFQRPRAHQVAFLQQRTNYNYRWAYTANTPSLVSGHCLQASLAGCTAFAALGKDMSNESIAVLSQFTMDIGDRRVFAGVHYPSDNLASWYVALNLLPRVFDKDTAQRTKVFLVMAIATKSHVFDAIRNNLTTDPDSPYRAIVAAIERSIVD